MKKLPIAIIAVVILVSTVFAYNYSQAGSIEISEEPQEELLGGGQRDIIRMSCQTATTSPEYIVAGAASSTCQAFIADAPNVDFRFMVNSTTTPSTLTYEYYVTEDSSSATRNWFLVDGSTEVNTLATTTTDLIPYRSYHKTDLSATYLRLDYAITDATADVYVEIIKDNQIK